MAAGEETVLEESDFILSETDEQGRIVSVNDDFLRISEFSKEELIGKPHNIVRHKDMPKAAFKDLWETVKSGKVWHGFVKNATKSGGYYWVYATVFPYTSCGERKGYLSCRKRALPEEIKDAEELYKTMK